MFVAFPVVTCILRVDLSLDEDFSDVIVQKLFNQPVEVRVRSGGLVYLLGKISRVV